MKIMSILSSLFHREIRDKPNEVHNVEPPDKALRDSLAGKSVQERFDALRKKQVRPAMYYSEEKGTPSKNGVWEDPHTVESKLEHREETPRG
ncbi:MAG: hypothetical protein RR675_02670 [Oscillospiraceae bacterium]